MDDIATSRLAGGPADVAVPVRFSSVGDGLAAAEAARSRGHTAGSLELLTELCAAFPEHPVPILRAAAVLSQLRRFDEAEALLAEGAARFPSDAGFLIERAWTAHRRGDTVEAEARFARVRQEVPNHPAGFTGGALTLRERGDFAAAEALLRQAMQQFPDEPGPLIDHAWLAHVQRHWTEAAARWQRVRDRHGSYTVGYTAGAGAWRETGRLDEAEALLDEAAARFPSEPAPLVERAWFAQHRRDWDRAIGLWEAVRTRFPGQIAAYTGAAQALRETGRLVEAEVLLAVGAERFPNDAGLRIEHAALASRRRDWAEAARRWDEVRARFPDHPASYTGAAQALREQRRFAEADAVLAAALQRFPRDAGVRSEHAWLAQIAGDWPEATRRWQDMRERHPDHAVGYTSGAVSLREQRRFGEAEALLEEAVRRFPGERVPLVEHAWLATAQRDWAAAAGRWEEVRRRHPDLVEGYLRGAQALATMWQHDDAEKLLAEAMAQFPRDAALATEYAWMAFHRHEFEDAAQRFAALRSRFPEIVAGYTAGALALRNLFCITAAESLLREAQERFPDDPKIPFEHAQLPMFHPLRRERDPEEALRRLAVLRERFPDFEDGYVVALRYLREVGRSAEGDALAEATPDRLSEGAALAIEYANNARERADWAKAIHRYEAARTRFPDNPGGAIGLAASLSMAGRHDDADHVLRETIERFPTTPAAFNEFGWIAARREDWATALTRWTEAQQRFPDVQDFAHRIFEARLRLADSEQPTQSSAEAAAAPLNEADPRDAMREMVTQFESLGGTGLGCEFGMFQREFGAEPLGLLRWADMPYDGVISVLENRFEGVGSEEHTELLINRENARPEYCTRDRRGFMYMRAFIYEDEMSYERMWKQALRRLRYLKDKLIGDLESGSKIFTYRMTTRNLDADELARLHAAVRSYGDNMLIYVRLEDAEHPNGTVEIAAPGLMIGYMDRFKMSPDGQLSASPPSASWMTICTRAHALWQGHLATAASI